MKQFKTIISIAILFLAISAKSQTKSDSLSILFKRMDNAGLMLQEYHKTHTNGLIKTIGGTLCTSGFSIAAIYSEHSANQTIFGIFAAASSIVTIYGAIELISSHKYIKKAGLYLSPTTNGVGLSLKF